MYQECANNCCKNDTFLRPRPKTKTAFRLRLRERIEGRTLEESTQKAKKTRPSNQHAKRYSKREPCGTFLGRFSWPRRTRHVTRLPFGAIAPQTRENTTFVRGQGLKHCKTRVLEGPRLEPGGGGAALWGAGKTTIWHLKVTFYEGSGHF